MLSKTQVADRTGDVFDNERTTFGLSPSLFPARNKPEYFFDSICCIQAGLAVNMTHSPVIAAKMASAHDEQVHCFILACTHAHVRVH